MINNTYTQQFNWQAKHLPMVTAILKRHAGYFLDFNLSNETQDKYEATDMVLKINSRERIAVRLRKPHIRFRDLTIRAKSQYGGTTELDKIKNGWCDWYFYGWVDGSQLINEYMILDIAQFRDKLTNRQITYNNDSTGFVNIPIAELIQMDAMLICHVYKNGYWCNYSKQF